MADNGKEPRIHFVEIQIQNHMRVRRAHVFLPERGVVPLVGSNRAGKTSFKRSLAALIGGDAEVEDAPRNRDAPEDEESYIVGTLSDGTTLRRSFTGAASSPKGRLTAKDAEDRQLSQRHLSAIVGPRALRPMRFLDAHPREQRETIMGFAPGLAEKLAEWSAERAGIEEQRRPHNSQLQVLGRIVKPEGERPEPVDVSAAMEELRGLQAAQRQRQDLGRAVVDVGRAIETNRGAQLAAQERIRQLELDLERARVNLRSYEIEGAHLVEQRTAATEAVEAVPSVDDEIQAVQDRISQADAVNASLKPWERFEEAQEAIKAHRTEAKRLTEALAVVERQKAGALAGADLPFTELSFDDAGEILIGGSPLSAASGMELHRLALEVAVADDPKLGVVFLNGNELDDDSLAETHRFAEVHDLQVIVERIFPTDLPGQVTMRDGVAEQAESPADAEPAEATS
jgi:hypothetical protein